MNKKNVRKLVLSRETVRHLAEEQLRNVPGAVEMYPSKYNSCDPASLNCISDRRDCYLTDYRCTNICP